MKLNLEAKTYLGDGYYAGHDSHQICVYASNGETDYNPVFLERDVMQNLIQYACKVYGKARMLEAIERAS